MASVSPDKRKECVLLLCKPVRIHLADRNGSRRGAKLNQTSFENKVHKYHSLVGR